MKKLLMFVWEIIIPRIVTEDVVVNWDSEDNFEIVCSVFDLEPNEVHMGVCSITSLSWLGFGFFGRMKMPPREFYNPNNGG
jgi:hypothetical protein